MTIKKEIFYEEAPVTLMWFSRGSSESHEIVKDEI